MYTYEIAAMRTAWPMINAYLTPETLAEATQARAAAATRILCGGTDFYTGLGIGLPTGTVIDLTRIRELDGISFSETEIRIGACTSWSKLVATPLPRAFDALKAAAREVGSIQIQNRATIGGNLCNASPAADGVPPLMALDAEVELASTGATRRLGLKDFILGNRRTALRADEILAAIVVPRRNGAASDEVSAFLKLGSRHYLVISIAMVAVNLIRSGHGHVAAAKVAVGACSPVAQRLTALEDDLAGRKCEAGLGFVAEARHLDMLTPIDDVRATRAYRQDAALSLVRRGLESCARSAGA